MKKRSAVLVGGVVAALGAAWGAACVPTRQNTVEDLSLTDVALQGCFSGPGEYTFVVQTNCGSEGRNDNSTVALIGRNGETYPMETRQDEFDGRVVVSGRLEEADPQLVDVNLSCGTAGRTAQLGRPVALPRCASDAGETDAGAPDGGPTLETDGGDAGPAGVKGYVYVAAPSSLGGDAPGAILQYAIGMDGKLAPLAAPAVTAGQQPSKIAVTPPSASGRYAYVTNYSDHIVSQYSVGANGALTPLSPPSITITSDAGATFPDGIAIVGTNVYVSNGQSSSISHFTIGANGTLTRAAAFSTASNPNELCALGQNLYVGSATPGNGISQYAIQGDGALALLTPPSVGTEGYTGIACRPGGENVYASGAKVGPPAGVVYQFARFTDGGALSALSPATAETMTSLPSSVVVAPTGTHALAVDFLDEQVALFAIGAEGKLAALTPATVSVPGVNSAAFHPSGAYVYLATGTGISAYAVGATTVTPLGAVSSTSHSPLGLVVVAP